MTRKQFTLVMLLQIALGSFAQSSGVKEINMINNFGVAIAPLRFLASDELMGRDPFRPEINIAALYIGEQFRSFGLKQVSGTNDYFQTFDMNVVVPASRGSITINGTNYEVAKDFVQAKGAGDVSLTAPAIFVADETEIDFDAVDVKGKIVVVNRGAGGSTGNAKRTENRKALRDKGALVLIERYSPSLPAWGQLQRYVTKPRVLGPDDVLPIFIIKDDGGQLEALAPGTEAAISVTGNITREVPAKNVIGWVEGTHPTLKNQFIVLSAHYDHLGVAAKPKMEEGKLDSIYNGARDNAIGATAVIDAARYFAQHPPKRSVLFIAYTAEELGLVGSRYFAENAPIPFNQLVYNLNIDNASYNDTTIVSVVGLGRTSADNDIKNACAAYGLTAMPDPAPEQGLFDRSDNVSLAIKGIPAPTFGLGVRKFDSTITNRYHQLSDEVGNFNLSYAMKYINAFILAAKNIADNKTQPTWVVGDKYEAAWKELFKNDL